MRTRRYRIPGRVEFLGKHVDYAGGRSLLTATDQGISVTAAERNDGLLRVTDASTGATAELHLGPDLQIPRGEWVAYPATVARRFARDLGALPVGLDLVLESDLPRDAGLSSSGAVIVAVALALADANRLAERPLWRDSLSDREALAGYLGAVENGRAFGPFAADGGVGTQGGSQDHTAILCARPGMLVQYGWIPVRFERAVPFPPGHVLAIAVSGVRAAKTRETLAHYNQLAEQAAELLRLWNRKSGRDDATLFAAIGGSFHGYRRLAGWLVGHPDQHALCCRLRQFWTECVSIVPVVASALAHGDAQALGAIVDRSQFRAEEGLRNQVPETIHLHRSARRLGALAASAFGAGFGGSVWALVPESRSGQFSASWKTDYLTAFPARQGTAEFLITGAGPPAREL